MVVVGFVFVLVVWLFCSWLCWWVCVIKYTVEIFKNTPNKTCHLSVSFLLLLPLTLSLWVVFKRGDSTSHLRTAKRFASGRVMMASTLQYISSSTYKDKITLKVLEELLGNATLHHCCSVVVALLVVCLLECLY